MISFAYDFAYEIKSVNKRILIAHFNGNPSPTVVVNYTPTEGSDDAEEHYEILSETIHEIPKHNVIIECGDYNAHLGKADVRHTFHEETNSNGSFLLEHAEECNLNIMNTLFEKKKGKQWTFISDMSGSKSKIDILVNKKWKTSS